jgi:hypothetical protein
MAGGIGRPADDPQLGQLGGSEIRRRDYVQPHFIGFCTDHAVEHLPAGPVGIDGQGDRFVVGKPLALHVEVESAAAGRQRVADAIVSVVFQRQRELRPGAGPNGIRIVRSAAAGQLFHRQPIRAVLGNREVQQRLIAVSDRAFRNLAAGGILQPQH